MKRITPLLLAIGFCAFALSGCGPSLSDPNQVQMPSVKMSKVAGTYLHSDGILMIKIDEVYETGWNGKLTFTPAIGDWTITPRCRVSDYDLAVEFVTGGERAILKFAHIDGPNSITIGVKPWAGTYTRIR